MREKRLFNVYDEVSKEYVEINKRHDSVYFAFYGELKKHYVKLTEEDLKRLKKNVKTALKKKFKMSMSEALELYQIDDRNEYTIELKGKMEKLGIN